VRHAPVPNPEGRCYGQFDKDCDVSNEDLFRHQAKLLPPLSNITGLQLVTMFADVTFSGATISGSNVSAQGSAQVTFADYATGTDTCEAGS
jgi:hypothetical protein